MNMLVSVCMKKCLVLYNSFSSSKHTGRATSSSHYPLIVPRAVSSGVGVVDVEPYGSRPR